MIHQAPTVGQMERASTRRALWIGTGLALGMGVYWAKSLAALVAYVLVLAAAILPISLWVRQGRPGVPILPPIGLLSILYYAFPIVRAREDLDEYLSIDLLRAAATVAAFLVLASIAGDFVLRKRQVSARVAPGLLSDAQMVTLVFLGLLLGIGFLGASAAGLLWGLGSFFGLARSVALTALVVACYFLGVARGRKLLRGSSWVAAGGGLGLAVLISWSSLYLVGGLIFLLAAGVGYVTTRGRIPWLALGVAVILVSILHAGKEEMRNRYWRQGGGGAAGSSIVDLPQRATEWFTLGLESLGSPSRTSSAIDRASLLQMLLRVQRFTPDFIDYLKGETYMLVPEMLVPRFLNPDKPISKAGMDLLSIRYGLMSIEGAETTTIGWGLIAEAYANFGTWGVAIMGLLVGLAGGSLTRWSARDSSVSVPTLMAVSAMIGMVNLEQDFASLITSLLQSFAAVLVLVIFLRLLGGKRRSPRPSSPAHSLEQQRQVASGSISSFYSK